MKRMPKAEMTVKDLANKETSGECTTSVCRLGFSKPLINCYSCEISRYQAVSALFFFFNFCFFHLIKTSDK